MGSIDMIVDRGSEEIPVDPLPFARNYQLEALERAIKQNTIVFLETGSGKTLIAIMLLRSYAYIIRRPAPFIAVFLVPTVVLVNQQSDAVTMHTDLKVGKFWGDMGTDYWDAATWEQQVQEHEVLVMTPQILLSALRHRFLKLDIIKVLIFDECHNARGKHPYACIMKEFYHQHLQVGNSNLPRVLGMTASPIKAKGSSYSAICWQQIQELENLMNSKVYTCVNESVIAEFVPFSTIKLKLYNHTDIPPVFQCLGSDLEKLRRKYEYSVRESSFSESVATSTRKKLDKVYTTLSFCLQELGVWLALKAAKTLASMKTDVLLWGSLDGRGETIVKNFCSDSSTILSKFIPSSQQCFIGCDTEANINAGYLTSKVICLFDSLLEYRDQKDLRCIIFVERIITAIVLQSLLNELLMNKCGWRVEYMAGNSSSLKSQSRNEQHHIVEDFRKGKLHVIVATSILEEGLDVQRCNLVIRFDPSATVCSFIQSRGRARMQNSDFLIMVKRDDTPTLNRVRTYVSCGDMMRQECLSHAVVPCTPLNNELCEEQSYKVQTTGAFVNLTSSVQVLYFYCSRLPCDGYFKSYPEFVIDKESGVCTLHLPRGCPLQTISVQGKTKYLKQLACLKACEQLHKVHALTDYLVPDIVKEEAEAQEMCYQAAVEEQVRFIPPELVGDKGKSFQTLYHCYLIELHPEINYDIQPHDIILAVRTRLEIDNESLKFELDVDRGRLGVKINCVGSIRLDSEEVLLCQEYQVTVFRALIDHNLKKLREALHGLHQKESIVLDYLLLPAAGSRQNPSINWEYVKSVRFYRDGISKQHVEGCASKDHVRVYTKSGFLCRCTLKNCLVCTPHNGFLYCITGSIDNLNSNSMLELSGGRSVPYTSYYRERHGIILQFVDESLLRGKPMFTVQNYLSRCRNPKANTKDPSISSVELPPELCSVIMSPISVDTLYSFSHAPSIMHRIESLLIAANLKRLHVDQCTQNGVIPTMKVLEAITTKKCLENFHLESLETLGDSFLKYAVSQHLFKTYQSHHEGLLSVKREKIISNASLYKLGCDQKVSGFIRNEPFDPKSWIVPGDNSSTYQLEREVLSTKRLVYIIQRREMKNKRVADVVEALIGAFLSTSGETAALLCMKWLGIPVDLSYIPHSVSLRVNPEKLINVKYLEALLSYKFQDASLLVEALTHGSYMLREIPTCYQRLEFLGDAVLDYLITKHLYFEHPGLSPGMLTDLRASSVNNDCYSQSAIKAGLHKHLLHASPELQLDIVKAAHGFEQSGMVSTFGWDSEIVFPKVLGDIIESLAGAILVDSGYDKEFVFRSIRPLLEPLITPGELKPHPVKELNELCQKQGYNMNRPKIHHENGEALATIEVQVDGVIHNVSSRGADKDMARKLASKAMLKVLKGF